MSNEELISKTISYLRFPLCVGVVFIHFNLSDGIAIHGVRYGIYNPNWYFFIIQLISVVLAALCVPLFYFFSGYLFFYGKEFCRSVYVQKIKTRVISLFVPYILWNVVTIIWYMKCFLPVVSSFFSPMEVHISIERVFNTFFCNSNFNGILVDPHSVGAITGVYPIDVPLWYIRDLMVMVVFSPVIYWAVRLCKIWCVLILSIAWVGSSFYLFGGSMISLYAYRLLIALLFFSWGAYYSVNKVDFLKSFRRIPFIPIVYLVVIILDIYSNGTVLHDSIHKLGTLIGVVSLVVVVSYLLEKDHIKVVKTLENGSFFVFALHYIFIGDLGKLVFSVLDIPDTNPYAMIAFYFVIPIISTLLCLSLYLILRSYSPKICRLFTGGR